MSTSGTTATSSSSAAASGSASTTTTTTTTTSTATATPTQTTTEPRKPSVSNWFSSLRRLPKKHKTAKKQLQKSCVDLSTISANNGVGSPTATATAAAVIDTHPASASSSVTNSPRLKNGINAFFNRDNKLVAAIKCATPPLTTISKTETLEIDQEKQISTGPKSPIKCITTMSTMPSAATVALQTTTIATMAKSPAEQQQQQLQITTTTKITQTTVITKQSHRVGMIFNDDGELISNLETYRNLANNLNNQLIIDGGGGGGGSSDGGSIAGHMPYHHNCGGSSDSGSHNNNTINSDYNCHDSFNGFIPNRPFKSNSLEDDFEFIDSSSSLSDIGGSRNDLYFNYNTLPKSCSTCKSSKSTKSMSDWNLSSKKVTFIFINIINIIQRNFIRLSFE